MGRWAGKLGDMRVGEGVHGQMGWLGGGGCPRQPVGSGWAASSVQRVHTDHVLTMS